MSDIAIRVVNLCKRYHLAFVAAMRLGLKALVLPNLALALVERGSLTAERMEVILEVIRPRYRVGVIDSMGSLTTLALSARILWGGMPFSILSG